MTLEERLVRRDVLHSAQELAGLPVEHPVDEQHRIAMRQQPADHADVEFAHGSPTLAAEAAALPPEGALFATWDGPASLMAPPRLRLKPLRCPPRGRCSRLGTARRRSSWLPFRCGRARRRQRMLQRAHAIGKLAQPARV